MRADELNKLRLEIPAHGDLTIWVNVIHRVSRAGFGVRFSAFSQGAARDKLAAIIGGQDGFSPSDQ